LQEIANTKINKEFIEMQYKVYLIKDNKSGSYGMPIYFKSTKEAKQIIVESFKADDELAKLQLSDYDLYQLGVFNRDVGDLEVKKEKKFITNLSNIEDLEGEKENE
jgi:hypothetical protein